MRHWARKIKQDSHAIYIAARDHRTPWYVKALALFIAGYALSPIDLIPDFIPVLGYIDDLIIIPVGIMLVVKMIPHDVMAEAREAARGKSAPISKSAAFLIIGLWIIAITSFGWLAWNYNRH